MAIPSDAGQTPAAGHALAERCAISPALSSSSTRQQRSMTCKSFCGRSREEAIIRAWQTEIVAQRLTLVLAPEQTAPLQFRHHLRAEVIEAAGQIGELHSEAVGGFGHEPFLHLIGDSLRSPYHGEATMAAEPLGELAHGEILAPGEIDCALPCALG